MNWFIVYPTPVPTNYLDVKPGDYVNIDAVLKTEKDKPVFIHFFNPNCPCSKFNIPHVRSLMKEYENKATFAVAVMCKDKYTEEEIRDKFDLDVPVLFDTAIAKSCGVYSTPQAVILDKDHKLYFRGNYNKSRYCTDKKSNFAQMALDSLVNNKVEPLFSEAALKAYGCQLPSNCSK